MAQITKEEVLKIAQISHIKVDHDELEPLMQKLQAVLSYAERVNEIAAQQGDELPHKAVNVFREDLVIPTNPEPILAQAPEEQEHYFVVPRILEN